jgi:hypothetical protein
MLAVVQPVPFWSSGPEDVHEEQSNVDRTDPAVRLKTWDSAPYLSLATSGYEGGSRLCAFYPLWPWLIGGVSSLTSVDPLVAGLILGNALAIAGQLLFFALVGARWGLERARESLVILLLFPSAFFPCFIYTEGLFFALTMVFFWGLQRQRSAWTAVAGLLLPLTRAVGIFCLLPLAWHLYERRQVRSHGWLLLMPLLGYAAYFCFMHFATGNALEGFEAQAWYPNQPSIANILNVPGFLHALVDVGKWHGMTDSLIDRILFVVFLASLPSIWRLDKSHFWFALGTGLIPAMSNWFFSYNRFLLMCFPLFIVLAAALQGSERRWLRRYYYCVLGTLQAVFVWRHVNFQWAG